MKVSPETLEAIKQDAISRYPQECCGFIVDGKYIALDNVHEEPERNFEIAASEWLKHGEVEAVVHSHCWPHDGREPSANDHLGQIATDVPWGIVVTDGSSALDPVWWGDFLLDEPLLGREFIHGINDCYTIIRAWYHQERGIYLKEQPRDVDWWFDGQNLYLDNFKRIGFHEVPLDEAQEGDVVLIRINGSRVPQHAALVFSPDLILHHLQNRQSCREPMARWRRFITHCLRFGT